MINDKILEAYEKMLNEKKKFNKMGKANDAMSDFLNELEDMVDYKSDDKSKFKKLRKEFERIDDVWEELWDKIIALAQKL